MKALLAAAAMLCLSIQPVAALDYSPDGSLVDVDEQDDDVSVEIAVGGAVRLTLDPHDGFAWQIRGPTEPALALYNQDTADDGEMVFTWIGSDVGSTTAIVALVPDEGGTPTQYVRIHVQVGPAD